MTSQPRDDMGKRVGKRVRHARHAAEMSQSQLARHSGITTTTISRVENGSLPGIDTLTCLALGLKVDVAVLLDGDQPPGRN